jgi:N-acetylneuraminate synthase
MKYDTNFMIDGHEISNTSPVFFIADLAANHDSSLQRAKDLISLAKECGASAVKFQHFLANKIVSDHGFKNLGCKVGHQSQWEKSVFEIYQQYECNRDWTAELYETAKREGITFLTSPYDYEAVDLLEQYIPAYKIGSGDITWLELIKTIALKGKPVLIAAGASTMNETIRAVDTLLQYNRRVVLMQFNTKYTADKSNFQYINLNVLRSFALKYPMLPLGLSDHTLGHTTVLGAISLGACVIEKHFTDDNTRKGPDHPFAMNPHTWKEMVKAAEELQEALGDGVKRVEKNEQETVVLQRRCIRVTQNLKAGEILDYDKLEFLRPAPTGTFSPHHITDIIGQKLLIDKKQGDALYPNEILKK